ncbi:response regulator transcription factor [Paenibacillus cremeus]|uniref:response regulator transcription factor n=1 Tax=Paenibacillus cremeus TaxID=2163881 RepID=UPI001C988CB2|nr:LuxR C-terminal-related transcriptional regulator [Paenibacillus cremeus]
MRTDYISKACGRIAKIYKLTNRETEILQYLCFYGCNNIELAERMFISVKTLKNHIHSIQIKTQSTSTRNLLAMVIRRISEDLSGGVEAVSPMAELPRVAAR